MLPDYVPMPWSFGVALVLGVATALEYTYSNVTVAVHEKWKIYGVGTGLIITLLMVLANWLRQRSLASQGVFLPAEPLNYASSLLFGLTLILAIYVIQRRAASSGSKER